MGDITGGSGISYGEGISLFIDGSYGIGSGGVIASDPSAPPANAAPVASNVLIVGDAIEGQILGTSFNYTDAESDVAGTHTYRWLRSDVAIAGATANSYTVVADDVGETLKFEVTPVALTGTTPGLPVQSPATELVTNNAAAPDRIFTLVPLGNGDVDSAIPDGGAGIASVAGTIADGQVLTITGAGLGSGPTNVMFENYSNGILGSEILATNTNFDIDTANTSKGIRVADSRSGSFANSDFNESATAFIGSRLAVDFSGGADTTEVFISYAVKVPTGSNFPGNDGGNSGTNADYSTDSSWKTGWLLGDGGSGTLNDVVIATHTGAGVWQTAGNDLGVFNNYGQNPLWWKWGKWNRISSWIKAGATPNIDAGNLYMQVANTETPIFEQATTPVIFANGSAPYRWGQFGVPGWMRDRVDRGGVATLHDDVYVAWGPNAAARVELGNAATYESCTDLAVCDRTSWVSGQIIVNCREGGLNLASPTWLFITLADNVTRYSMQVVL